MGKESVVEIPHGSGNRYRYEYSAGSTIYKGPVGSAPDLGEAEFLDAIEAKKTDEEIVFADPKEDNTPPFHQTLKLDDLVNELYDLRFDQRKIDEKVELAEFELDLRRRARKFEGQQIGVCRGCEEKKMIGETNECKDCFYGEQEYWIVEKVAFKADPTLEL